MSVCLYENISLMGSLTVSYFHSNDLLKLLFTRQCYCAPSLINSALSSEISLLSRLPSLFSKLCFQGQMQYLPFSPLFYYNLRTIFPAHIVLTFLLVSDANPI